MIEFESNIYDDVELRSKDEFALSSIDGKPIILQNFNVSKYWQVNQPEPEMSFGAIVLSVLFIFIIIAIAMNS